MMVSEKVVRKAKWNTLFLALFFGLSLAQSIEKQDIVGTALGGLALFLTLCDFSDLRGMCKEIDELKKQKQEENQ